MSATPPPADADAQGDHPQDVADRTQSGGRDALFDGGYVRAQASFFDDVRASWRLHPMWRTFAWDEIQQRYRRSRLGIAWIVLSYLVFVLLITVFFGGFSRKDDGAFLSYVAIGFAVFTFLLGNLIDGCAVFKSGRVWILSTDLPYGVFVFKSIARSSFVLLLNLVCAFLLLLLVGWRPTALAWLSVPALAVTLGAAVWVQYLFGLLGARFRDVEFLIQTLGRLLFFTTPILWVHEERGGLVRQISTFNPFTHFVEIVRAPLLGEVPERASWLVVAGLCLGGLLVTNLYARRERARLPFYV